MIRKLLLRILWINLIIDLSMRKWLLFYDSLFQVVMAARSKGISSKDVSQFK